LHPFLDNGSGSVWKVGSGSVGYMGSVAGGVCVGVVSILSGVGRILNVFDEVFCKFE